MNAEHINPFIKGSQAVINSVCGESPALGKAFIKNPPFEAQPVAITVAVSGGINGTVAYCMQQDTGLFIASKMMGMAVADLDPMSQSALSELVNMVSGNVATAFAGMDIKAEFQAPVFQSSFYPALTTTVACVPLTLQNGMVFEVNVCLA